MFTGIIEETGRISAIKRGVKSSALQIAANRIFDDLKTGDSVAVNGVCLTVTKIENRIFCADVMSETLSRSSLGELRQNSPVNLERAMAADGRFGGHIVSGHIDGTGTVMRIERDDNAVWYTIKAPEKIMTYIVEKGSVAIDGISLTVAKAGRDNFSVSVIPHTMRETILYTKRVGSKVNLENDIVGKYVERFVQMPKKETEGKGITAEFLAKAGF